MIAPTLNGFFERWMAIRRGVRRRSSSRRISSSGISNGATYMGDQIVFVRVKQSRSGRPGRDRTANFGGSVARGPKIAKGLVQETFGHPWFVLVSGMSTQSGGVRCIARARLRALRRKGGG